MPNVVSYIEKLLGKPGRKTAPVASYLNRSIKGWGEVIRGEGCGNRYYNKANLWVVFNRFDMDASERIETSRRYPLKSHNQETTGLLGNS
nr:hypothetical protein [uncultured Mucilaginibacter sp.]